MLQQYANLTNNILGTIGVLSKKENGANVRGGTKPFTQTQQVCRENSLQTLQPTRFWQLWDMFHCIKDCAYSLDNTAREQI